MAFIKFIRTISALGASTGVTIPKEMLEFLGVEKTNNVALIPVIINGNKCMVLTTNKDLSLDVPLKYEVGIDNGIGNSVSSPVAKYDIPNQQ